jgi:acetyl-CoA carboxylase biotin carboxylase subunit
MMSNWRVLVANRGEIAVRIINACKEMGIETVVTVSESDRESLPAKLASRAVCIGPPRSIDSYLKVGTIIAAALGTNSNAIHPGYGFLCEQPELAEACVQNGIIFIGPTADNIRKMGDKDLARKIAEEAGVPIIPGSDVVQNYEEAVTASERVGYPVLLKAAAGGGGRGILIVRTLNDLKTSFDVSSAEAYAAFGDDRLYIEHLFDNARHIEVQVLGDQFGNVIHLGERDCSVQRRYQKIVEEAPSPIVSTELRQEMTSAALAIANYIRYESAGTVEFIIDLNSHKFYFMEMNTRIQVEHPVTEMITGLDLIKEQIKIAAKSPLGISQSSVRFNGHAIECRINAESPEAGFTPCPGKITQWLPPQGPDIRVDTHCFDGYLVPPYYDSLIAKVITAGKNRNESIERMKYALANFAVAGIDTTLPFHRILLNHPDFVNGKVNTRWVEESLLPVY